MAAGEIKVAVRTTNDSSGLKQAESDFGSFQASISARSALAAGALAGLGAKAMDTALQMAKSFLTAGVDFEHSMDQVGAVAGGVFSGWFSRVRRQGLVVVVSIVLWGLGMIGFGLAAHLWVAVLFLAFGGAVDMVSAAFRSTILQEAASDELRGRLQGVFIVVVAGGPRMGDVLHGAAAAAVGTTIAAAGGGGLVVIGVLLASLAVPAFVRYRIVRAVPD